MRRIFHIDLDAFFVAVEGVLEPWLRGKPVVVGGSGVRGVVASASYEAREFGIHAGMPLEQARRLCPPAVFLEGRFSHYQEASDRFFFILSRYTPDMEIAGIDEAYLDMTGTELLYGPPLEVGRRIKEQVYRKLGLTCSVGIASSKLVAKVASDLGKPDGLLEVPQGEERQFLSPLPVGRLPGVGYTTEKVLGELGVKTIGELAAVPLALLKHLFGVAGLDLHRHAQGIDSSPLEPPQEAKSVSRSTTFPCDTLDRSFLEAVLGYLSERVAMELRRQGKRARCVVLKVRYGDFETLSRQRALGEATDTAEVLFQVGRELLEGLLKLRLKLVRLLGIGACQLVPGEQLPLWGERQRALDGSWDRLREKYGFTILERGRTFSLRRVFAVEQGDYLLHTPCLSR